MRNAHLAAIAATLFTSFVAQRASAQCVCPTDLTPGLVTVDLAFDRDPVASPGRGRLNSSEIQCAIDCLNGDALSESDLFLGAPATPGGEIRFAAGIAYDVDRPLHLPARTSGTLRVIGHGARLYSTLSVPAVFERHVPPTADNSAASAMRDYASGWVIEGLSFKWGPGPGSPPSSGATTRAIDFHAMRGLTIRECWFYGFPRAIELHYVTRPTIARNEFDFSWQRDITLGDGYDCDGAPCWLATGNPVGCDGARIEANRHFNWGGESTSFSTEAGIRINNSNDALVLGDAFEGGRPQQCIYLRHVLGSRASVRGLRVEYYPTSPPQGDHGLIHSVLPGALVVEGLTLVSPHTEEVIDVSELHPRHSVSVRVSNVDAAPFVVFDNGSNPWKNAWRFDNVNTGGVQPLTSAARWVPSPAGSLTVVPLNLTVDANPVVGSAPPLRPLRQRVLAVERIGGFPQPSGVPTRVEVTERLVALGGATFAGRLTLPTPPAMPQAGDMWYAGNRFHYFDGTSTHDLP